MAQKARGFSGPRVHHIGPGEQVIFHGAHGQELPMVAVVIGTPQGIPIVLAQSDQIDKEMLMLACLQMLMVQRRQVEQSPLAKAGFVAPPGVMMPTHMPGPQPSGVGEDEGVVPAVNEEEVPE